MTNIFVRALAIILVVAGIAACGSSRPAYKASEVPQTAAPQASEYVIGPGDGLQIFVWDHPDLSTPVQVRPDGQISTPLVEDLQAAGRTPTQLARDIEGVLKEYVRTPVVTVIMQGFIGESTQRIRVVGPGAAPQALQYKQGMTVLDVVIEAGGLGEFAAGNRAKIVRDTSDGQVEIKVRLHDLINDGDVTQNVKMMPGDMLVIPQSFF